MAARRSAERANLDTEGLAGRRRLRVTGPFDPTAVKTRLERLWGLDAVFGVERRALQVYLEEIVSDRYSLVNGMHVLRDELQFASPGPRPTDLVACRADFSLPSVVTTLAHTNCGDRIHQGNTTRTYREVVGSRFASLSEIGEPKVESFTIAGGGTDDGATLAHVTVSHQLDEPLKRQLYAGNPLSYVLVAVDLMAHVGRLELDDGRVTYGRAQESPWREARPACGAIVGALQGYNPENAVHRRLRRDLGEDNFAHLAKTVVRADDGTDVTAAIAASIVAIRGMRNTLEGLAGELDERGIGHVTACLTVNRTGDDDTILYLARGTLFGTEIRFQGLGTQATKYAARMIDHKGERRLALVYDGCEPSARPTQRLQRPTTPRGEPTARSLRDSDELPPTGETLFMKKKKER